MADCVHYEDIVRYVGRRAIVDREWSEYPARPGVRMLLGFAADGGGWVWADLKNVEKLPTVFLGMPNEDHMPEPGEPLTLWQQIPHEFDSYLWSDSWSARCLYCGLPQGAEIHTQQE